MDKKSGPIQILMDQGFLQKDDESHEEERREHEKMVKKMEAESAARTLMEAQKIRGDRELFRSAKEELKKMAQSAKKAIR